MASTRRKRHHTAQGGVRVVSAGASMDKLAFKYMEMCKVESSTDSESDISPRYSDTSTMGCGSSSTESRPVQRSLVCGHKPASRYALCQSLFLDPYDGSSEDSDVSDPLGILRRQKQPQGGCRYWGRKGRRAALHSASTVLRGVSLSGPRDIEMEPGRGDQQRDPGRPQQHQLDILDSQMRSASDLDLWRCGLESPPPCWDGRGQDDQVSEMVFESGRRSRSVDSGLHTTPTLFTPVEEKHLCLPEMSPEKSLDSPFPLRCVSKRKLGLLGVPSREVETSKKLCISRMDKRGDSTMEVYGVW